MTDVPLITSLSAAHTNFEVIFMEQKYSDLFSLIDSNAQAHQYFSSLPDYVQEEMDKRAQNINSFESLCDYADNLTRGDN